MIFDRLTIYLEHDSRSTLITSSRIVFINLHSPNTIPFGGFSYFSPGHLYIIKYSQWNIIRLGKGYDTDCTEYDTKKYTRNDCIFDCYQDRAKYHCQTENIVSCHMLKKKSYFEQSNLNFSKCKMKIKLEHEILELCYVQCKQDCHITYYPFTITKHKEIDINRTLISIEHNHMPDITIRHIPEMPLLTFICNFGGILGMWLGVSFIGILNSVWKLLRAKILSKISIINMFIMNNNNNNIINQNIINNNHNNILFIPTNNRRNLNSTRITT